MRKTSTALTDLVNSLTRNEKGYFKKTIGHSERDNKYVKVFDYIERYGTYDVDKIRKETGIKNLARVKNYLHKSILRSLRQFHAGQSTISKISELIHDAQILVFKLLYDQAEKTLDKAEVLANEHELFHSIIPIYELRRYLHIRNQPSSTTMYANLQECTAKTQQAIDHMSHFQKYCRLRDRSYSVVLSHGTARKEEEQHMLDDFIDDPLLAEENRSSFYWTEIYRLQALHYFYNNRRDFDKCYENAVRMIDHMESRPHIIREFPATYVTIFHFLHTSTWWSRRFELLEKNYERLSAFLAHPDVPHTRELDVIVFVSIRNTQLNAYLQTADAKRALEIAGIIEAGLEKYEPDIPAMRKLFFYVNLTLAYFLNGDHHTALAWLNKALDMSEVKLHMQALTLARMLLLILHYELNNTELLPYVVRSTYRYLVERDRLFRFEKVFIDFIRHFPAAPSKKEMAQLFTELKARLLPLREDPEEAPAFEEFDYICWLDSKIENRPYVEVLKEYVESNR